jgi:putative intracellular protease/amidase
MSDRVLLLVFDGYADWEPALACAELNKTARFDVHTVGLTVAPVTSMAGLRVVPDLSIDDAQPDDAALVMLPGGNMWEELESPAVTRMLHTANAAGVPVAAICAGTICAARAGLLDTRAHTSNFPGYIDRHVPAYRGAGHYRDSAAVADRGLITASGMGSVEFAYEILQLLSVYGASDLQLWLTIFRDKRVPEALRA